MNSNSCSVDSPFKPTSWLRRAPEVLSKAYVSDVSVGTRPHTVSRVPRVLPSAGSPFSYDLYPSLRMSSLTSPRLKYKSPPSLVSPSTENGSIIQNWIYSMFDVSKLVLSSLRMMPPQRFSGLRRLKLASIFVWSRLYGPRSAG